MVVANISVIPIGTGSTSLSSHVAKAISTLNSIKGVKYELTAMGTIIEGDLDLVFDAVRKMHATLFDAETKRVLTTVVIDDRRDQPLTMKGKVESVIIKLG